ncbi:Aste57867_10783 [Aphanomyces stellatus]|uniref:Aste57867_10783 protein n=1 Tax=Aphanomyces stellatus TaxID=120398 RepID=A0A485KSE9_9STRA|nr:hypothetical protein As57867_010743 [Aphanomyces stellatus]VFT87653.1 Aste57867_10783 [Aphanomyces stellatus]
MRPSSFMTISAFSKSFSSRESCAMGPSPVVKVNLPITPVSVTDGEDSPSNKKGGSRRWWETHHKKLAVVVIAVAAIGTVAATLVVVQHLDATTDVSFGQGVGANNATSDNQAPPSLPNLDVELGHAAGQEDPTQAPVSEKDGASATTNLRPTDQPPAVRTSARAGTTVNAPTSTTRLPSPQEGRGVSEKTFQGPNQGSGSQPRKAGMSSLVD